MKRFFVFLLLPLVGACSSVEEPQQHAPAIADWLASSVQLFSERDGGQRRFGSGVSAPLDSRYGRDSTIVRNSSRKS